MKKLKKTNNIIFKLTFLFVLLLPFVFLAEKSFSQTSDQPGLDVVAYLIDSENNELANGNYQIRFALYRKDRTEPDPTDSDTKIWEETIQVELVSGFIRAIVGKQNPFPTDPSFKQGDFYLGIRIGDDAEMVPRKKIGTSFLALNSAHALDSEKLNGSSIGINPGNIPILGSNSKLNKEIIPEIDSLGVIQSGTWEGDKLRVFYGGTGLTNAPKNGQILIGNGDGGYDLSNLTADLGISIDNSNGSIKISNSDLGSSQNIFKNITDGTNTAVSESNNDTLRLLAGNNVTITVGNDDETYGDYFRIDASGSGSSSAYTAGNLLQLNGAEFSVKAGTLIDDRYCKYIAGTGLVCDSTVTAVESDPIFIAHAANTITSINISNWNTVYGWGNHSTQGYLTSYTESDPVFIAWDKTTGISITESQISDLQSYLTGTKVDSFNTRTGAVTLTSGDVTTALTFTPYNATNPSNYITTSSSDTLTNKSGNISMWTNDSSYLTGISSSDTDSLPEGSTNLYSQWTTTGSNVYFNTGNVGVNDTNPTYNLDVNGTLNATSVYANGVLLSPGTGSNWSVSSSNIFRSVGNVGIGTSSPTSPLWVKSSGSTSPNSNGLFVYNTTNSTSQHSILAARVAGSSGGDPFVSLDISGEYGWSIGVDNSDGNKFKIARSWSALSTSTAMTINTGGNIGIGTDNPTEKLELDGNIKIRGGDRTIQMDSGYLGISPKDATYGIMLRDYTGVTTVWSNFRTVNDTTDYLHIGMNSTSSTDGIVISDSSNVGIGKTTPIQKLEVVGGILASGATDNGPDSIGVYSGTYSTSHGTVEIAGPSGGWIDFSPGNGTDYKGRIRYYDEANDYMNFYVNTGEKLRIKSNSDVYVVGNLGIGEVNPGTKLSVSGGMAVGTAYDTTAVSDGRIIARYYIGIGTTNPLSAIQANSSIDTTPNSAGAHLGLTGTIGELELSGSTGGIIDFNPGDGTDYKGRIRYYDEANDYMNFYVNTGEKLRIKSNSDVYVVGNLGIGEVNPGTKLSVSGGMAVGTAYDTTAVSDGKVITSGNIGIGTTNPLSSIQIGGNVDDSPNSAGVHLGKAGTRGVIELSGATGGYIDFNPGDGTNYKGRLFYDDTTNDYMSFYVNAGEKLRIKSDGNVGIGETNPGAKLSVSGGLAVGTAYDTIAVSDGRIITSSNVGIGTNSPTERLEIDGNIKIRGGDRIIQMDSGYLDIRPKDAIYGIILRDYTGGTTIWSTFRTVNDTVDYLHIGMNSSSSTDGIVISDSSNVGIGETNPGAKLSVSGGLAVGSDYDTTTVSNGNIIISGNIGIGTTSPSQKLDIIGGKLAFGNDVGAITYERGVYWDDNSSYGIYRTVGSWDSPNYQQLRINWSTGIILDPGSGSYGKSHVGIVGGLSVGDTYYSTEYDNGLIVQGRVGIGTTSPASALQIKGNVDDTPNYGGVHLGEVSSRGVIELSGTSGGYIDFNPGDGTNYKGRLFYDDTTDDYMSFHVNTGEKLRIQANGNVGINDTTPTYKLDVNGTIRGYTITDSSDERLKKNITSIEGGILDKLTKLRPVSYNWKDSLNLTDDLQIGLIAQELEKEFPNLVSTDSEGYKSIQYGKLSAINIEAIKELNNKDLSIDDKVIIIGDTLENVDSQLLKNNNRLSSAEIQLSQLTKDIYDFNYLNQTATDLITEHELRITELETQLAGMTGGGITLSDAFQELDSRFRGNDGEDGYLFTVDGDLKVDNFVAGKITTEELKIGEEASGKGIIESGEKEVIIETAKVTEESKIYLTIKGATYDRIISYDNIIEGESFEVKLNGAADGDIKFDWLVIK